MTYVTIAQLALHTGKSHSAVERALKAAKLALEKHPGVKGRRLGINAANRFIARQWPGLPLLPIE